MTADRKDVARGGSRIQFFWFGCLCLTFLAIFVWLVFLIPWHILAIAVVILVMIVLTKIIETCQRIYHLTEFASSTRPYAEIGYEDYAKRYPKTAKFVALIGRHPKQQ